jgi:phenylacetate-CoA ligase
MGRGDLRNQLSTISSFFRLRSPAGTSWPAVPIPELSQIWAAYQELDRTQWLSPDELERHQLQQVRVLVQHCVEHVPYYRRVLAEADLLSRPIECLEDFRRLPFLTRELYQQHATELLATKLPTGMQEVSSSYTSGTNGVPIMVRKTNRDGLWWSAFYLRDLEWSGIDPRGRLAAIRFLGTTSEKLKALLAGVSAPNWGPLGQSLIENGPAFAMEIRQDPRLQLDWLDRIRPNYLLSMPTNLDVLANLALERGQRFPDLKAIQTIGEPLPFDMRQRIETAFGVPVKNLYSTTEGGYVASSCPEGNGLHVHGENLLTEVLDADDRPCQPGQTGRLIITSLNNFVNPFLRYEMLDDVTLAAGPCPCGRGLPLWQHVEGRRHPLFFLPDGRRLSSMGANMGVRKVGGCHQFQIIQREVDRVIIRVVPDKTWTPNHADQMRSAIHREFALPVQVDVETHEFLERPAGGKLKMVVVELERR